MDEKILVSIKKLLGITEDDTSFDADILMHINSVFNTLKQLGVGPRTGFTIEDDSEAWSDFLTDQSMLSAVKSYIYLRVRLLFDPPTISSLVDAIKQQIAEYEWRLNVDAETNWATIE